MKKINLKNLSTDEILSKDELKKIVGGDGSGEPKSYTYFCYCNNDVIPCKSFQVNANSPGDTDPIELEMWYCCNYEYNPNSTYHCEAVPN